MKLESYWIFVRFFLCSAIVVVSKGYIMLISLCTMLKTGKMQSIASSANTCKFI